MKTSVKVTKVRDGFDYEVSVGDQGIGQMRYRRSADLWFYRFGPNQEWKRLAAGDRREVAEGVLRLRWERQNSPLYTDG